MPEDRAASELVAEVIGLFYVFRKAEERMHGDGDLGEPQRALLFALQRLGPATVPAIAREQSLTRQRVQQIANELLERGLLEKQQNPASRRSPLLRLSRMGQKRVLSMLGKEQRLYRSLPRRLGARRIGTALTVLRQIRREVER